MADTTPLVPNPRLNEMAMAYCKDRLHAIDADVSAVEKAQREGMLTQDEFLTIRRSLMQAKGEVQVALETITSANDAQ